MPGKVSARVVLSFMLVLAQQAPCLSAQDTAATYNLVVQAGNAIRAGDLTGARATLDEALKAQPDSWDANYYMGMVAERAGNLDEAVGWYQKAVPLDSGRYEALIAVARVYYNQRDYKDALPIFEQLALSHPATEHTYDGYLALARCYAETGRYAEACATFDKALAVKPNNPSGWRFAGQELDWRKQYNEALKYYKEYVRRFPSQPDVAQITARLNILSYEGAHEELDREAEHGFQFDSDTDDIKGFVTFLDPQHRGVSDTAVAQVMLGLKEIPRTYRHQLESAGFKVLVVPTVLDALPQLGGQRPRGFGGGQDWHNANGTFDRRTRTIIVAEKIDVAGQGTQEAVLDETVQHEFGHAYDYFLGLKRLGAASAANPNPEISQGSGFSQAYDRDVRNLPANLRGTFAYFLQSGAAGKEELFAQLFPIFFGNPPPPGSYGELFKVAFPNVLALVAEARKNDPDYERLRDTYDAKLKQNLLLPWERTQQLLSN